MVKQLETTHISVHELFKGTLYLHAQEFWKTSSSTPHTGPGRLQFSGRRGSTVVGGFKAFKVLGAGVRPDAQRSDGWAIACRANFSLLSLGQRFVGFLAWLRPRCGRHGGHSFSINFGQLSQFSLQLSDVVLKVVERHFFGCIPGIETQRHVTEGTAQEQNSAIITHPNYIFPF